MYNDKTLALPGFYHYRRESPITGSYSTMESDEKNIYAFLNLSFSLIAINIY